MSGNRSEYAAEEQPTEPGPTYILAARHLPAKFVAAIAQLTRADGTLVGISKQQMLVRTVAEPMLTQPCFRGLPISRVRVQGEQAVREERPASLSQSVVQLCEVAAVSIHQRLLDWARPPSR